MKSKDIKIRGGHLLKHIDGDIWEFVPSFENCPVYLTYNEKKTDIIALDAPDMGMPLLVGCQVDEYKIYGIHEVDAKFVVCMMPVIKEKASQLAVGDILYITDEHENSLRKITVSKLQTTYACEYVLIFYKEKDDDCIIVKADHPGSLKCGVETDHFSHVKVFTDEKHAKKYLYDKLQDKIGYLREAQRRLMVEATR